jgi:hypothetical protein
VVYFQTFLTTVPGCLLSLAWVCFVAASRRERRGPEGEPPSGPLTKLTQPKSKKWLLTILKRSEGLATNPHLRQLPFFSLISTLCPPRHRRQDSDLCRLIIDSRHL